MSSMPNSATCPNCGGTTQLAFEIQDYNRKTSEQEFRYMQCNRCSVFYLVNVPLDLARYYPADYYTIARSIDELAAWAATEQYKIDLIRKFRTAGHLVEIGPASGSFCYLAKSAGFDVTAIEMDARCSEYLASTLGISVVNSADEAAALERVPAADVIAMWHVIEHLADPWAMLEVAARKLKPGGVLILAAPNPSSMQFRVLGRRWVHIDAPRHLWLIPAAVLVARAERLGFSTILQTTRDKGSLAWNRFGWEYTLMNNFASAPARRAAANVGRMLAVMAAPLESREGRGAAYTVAFQKPAA